jgi:hypothetical protein
MCGSMCEKLFSNLQDEISLCLWKTQWKEKLYMVRNFNNTLINIWEILSMNEDDEVLHRENYAGGVWVSVRKNQLK